MPRIKLSPQSQPSKSREAQIPTPVPPPILNLPFELVSEDIFNILRSYLSQILRFEEFEVEVSSNELRELTELICKKVEEYTIAARDVAEEDQREWINNHMRVKDRDSASISASDTRLKIKEEELDSGHELDELERTEASEFPLGSGVEKGKAAQILTQASTLDGVPPIIQRPSRNTFKKTIPQKTRDGTSCVENEQRDSLSSGKTTYTVDMKLAISELESLSTRDRSNDKIPETVPSLSNTTGLEARASRRVRAPPRFSSEEGTTATGSENVLQDLKTNCYERPASSLDNRKRRNIKVGGDQIILRPEPTRAAIPRKDASRKALEKQKTAVELESIDAMDLDKNVPVLRARRTPPAKPVPKIARSRTGVRFDMRELMEQAKEQAAQLPLQKESSTDPIIPAGPLSSSSVGNRRVSSRKRTPKGK